MLSKSEIKRINALKIKKYRTIERCFIAEGPKIIPEFIKEGFIPEFIAATSAHLPALSVFFSEIREITEDELSKISALMHPQGCLAVFRMKNNAIVPHHKGWAFALDGIQDPGNLGTIIRIADWFGMNGIFCSEDTVDIFNPKVIQASMGSAARVVVQYTQLPEIFSNTQCPIFAGLLEGTPVQNILPKQENGIILIGNEGNGIRASLLPYATHAVTIPKLGDAESLNAAVAAGIMAAMACLSR